ncbi:uncharacterized protein LOC125236759 [Leguminivora glycinivorella]|uniref:uncharacterized protein LOC125236759 n=1 Tax=Leguminivora glycinivorella TaxID=1035111 RepID=UPI002010158F|nr:uncharacterized protein LOC125236759 [Leguminivora glycinivorella]
MDTLDNTFSYILNYNNYIEDDVVRAFHEKLLRCTSFRPRELELFQHPELIEPVPKNETHLQVIYDGDVGLVGHWSCIYYINGILRVYDSLVGVLGKSQKIYVKALFPYLSESCIQFPSVQRQPNTIDCGLFAIAFATSLALKTNPSQFNYVPEMMRPHLLEMLLTDGLLAFPATSRRSPGRAPSNLFNNIALKLETNKQKQTEKKQKHRSQNSITSHSQNDNLNFNQNYEYVMEETQSIANNCTTMDAERIKQNNRDRKRLSRSNKDVSIREKERNQVAKEVLRSNKRKKCHEQVVNSSLRRSKRLNLEIRQVEQERDTEAHRAARQDDEYRRDEQQRNTQAHRVARTDVRYRQAEQERDTEAHRAARQDDEYRRDEQQRNTQAHRVARTDVRYRQAEQERDTEAHRAARQDDEYRRDEQQRNTQAHRVARMDVEFREAEQERDTHARRVTRENEEYRRNEQMRNSAARQELRSKQKDSWDLTVQNYLKNIKEGNTHPCHCCGRLWHINSIKKISKDIALNKYGQLFVDNVFHLNPTQNYGEFCSTCARYINKGTIPRLARANGLIFPCIPEVLKDLTPLEERLVSPRHVFLKIVRRGQGLGFQHGLQGNVVNVPVLVNNMVSALPRSVNDDNVITVELKRRFCYRHGRKEQVRPEFVRRAAQYLVQCELFQENGVALNVSWAGNDPENETRCTCDADAIDEETVDPTEGVELNPGGTETLLDDNQDVIVLAPGEGQRPISLLFDEHLEELAFIKVHCGVKRDFKINLRHSEIIKSEISRQDRRAVRPDYLFTALKKQQMTIVKNSITTCLRKKTVKGTPVLASNVLDMNYIDNLVQHDDGYRVLSGIRNSPSHWEGEKKKVLAMIRQFGVPSFFLTLSAAEVQWLELLVMLKEVVDGETVSLYEVENLSYETKARLIQSDPFICASYFETKLREIRKTWSCSSGPFGKYVISHFYYRIEFQHRGSPHAHMMLWLEEAPIFVPGDVESAERVVQFVDNILTCDSNELTEDILHVQKHKHTHTCRPKPDKLCRFDIPFFPLDSTQILVELPKDNASYKRVKDIARSIQIKMQDIPPEIETFTDFLEFVGVTYENYILAIRSTLKRPKVFLKRSPKDTFGGVSFLLCQRKPSLYTKVKVQP